MIPIKEIIEQGESETLEFKPSFNQDDVVGYQLAHRHESNIGLSCVANVYLYSGNVSPERHTTTASRIRVSGSYTRSLIRDGALDALREALTNAVCHRDYCDLGDIQIKVYDQSLQIWSPGFLPFGMTVEELLRPNHSSKPRNRLIAQAFYDMGMIEQYGSGIKRVVDACVEAGLPEPEFENFSGGFQVALFGTCFGVGSD